jgi:hypothetical protein
MAQNLIINYSFPKVRLGISLWFLPKESAIWPYTNEETAFPEMNHYPNAQFLQITDSLQQAALLILIKRLSTTQIKLHLKGTDFQ